MSPSLKTFSSLKHPPFRFYLGMYLCQYAAMDMRTLAQPLLIYRLTGSVALLGVVALVNAVPGILLPLVGGVIADRLPKKYTILLGQASAMFTSLLVALSLTFGLLSAERAGSWWIVMAASFINYGAAGLVGPSRQAIIAELVGTDHIMNAVSLRSLGYNVIHLGAPAIAGVVIDVFSFEVVYYTASGFSLLALVLTLFLPLTGTGEANHGNVLSQMKDGLKYVRGEGRILFILAFTMAAAVLATPYSRLMPVFVDDILKVGATGMGVLLSASAVGALISSLAVASLPSKRRGALMLISAAALGLSLVGFAISRSWYVSIAFVALVGMARTARATMSNTLLQSYTAAGYRGRVMSLYAMEDGITSLGSFIAAMVAVVAGVTWTVAGFACALVLLSLLAVFLPGIRKLE
ncbi:MAG: MFS transporter [Dehalococcoidia bacterium]|jgi:MFS family permease|nr:MAG: MFS transporter [Dehalococcoidia bacterium]